MQKEQLALRRLRPTSGTNPTSVPKWLTASSRLQLNQVGLRGSYYAILALKNINKGV